MTQGDGCVRRIRPPHSVAPSSDGTVMQLFSTTMLLCLCAAGCTPYIPVKDEFGVSALNATGDIPPEFAAFNRYDPRINPLLAEQMCATPYQIEAVKALDAEPGEILAAASALRDVQSLFRQSRPTTQPVIPAGNPGGETATGLPIGEPWIRLPAKRPPPLVETQLDAPRRGGAAAPAHDPERQQARRQKAECPQRRNRIFDQDVAGGCRSRRRISRRSAPRSNPRSGSRTRRLTRSENPPSAPAFARYRTQSNPPAPR